MTPIFSFINNLIKFKFRYGSMRYRNRARISTWIALTSVASCSPKVTPPVETGNAPSVTRRQLSHPST
jgi:hypothetical protein